MTWFIWNLLVPGIVGGLIGLAIGWVGAKLFIYLTR
jgi:hypothetical protein